MVVESSVPSTAGNTMVVVGTPEGAAKMFRAEGKYPVRGAGEENMAWIYKNIMVPVTMAFA